MNLPKIGIKLNRTQAQQFKIQLPTIADALQLEHTTTLRLANYQVFLHELENAIAKKRKHPQKEVVCKFDANGIDAMRFFSTHLRQFDGFTYVIQNVMLLPATKQLENQLKQQHQII